MNSFKKRALLLVSAGLLVVLGLTLDHSRPSPLRDALASPRDSAAELGAAFEGFKNRGVSDVSSVPGVALEAAQPQVEARREVSRHLIPEVLSLKKGQLLPRSLFEKHGTNAIAESLIERLRRMEINQAGPVASGDLVDMWTETELHRFEESEKFFQIVKTGMKNGFQVGTTHGTIDFVGKNIAEETLLEIKLIDHAPPDKYWEWDIPSLKKVNEVRPKYGIAFFPDLEADLGAITNILFSSYGDFIWIFNNQLKLRSTWVKCDSWARLSSGNPLYPDRTFWARMPKSTIPERVDDMCTRNFEIQVFGNIGIEDVQAIGVYPLSPIHGGTPSRFRELVLGAGFKVVEFETYDIGGQTLRYRRGRILSEGDPAKLARWIQRVRAGEISDVADSPRGESKTTALSE